VSAIEKTKTNQRHFLGSWEGVKETVCSDERTSKVLGGYRVEGARLDKKGGKEKANYIERWSRRIWGKAVGTSRSAAHSGKRRRVAEERNKNREKSVWGGVRQSFGSARKEE